MDKLLVIGNGFDLKLEAKTKYSDFFTSSFYSETKMASEEWIEFIKHRDNVIDAAEHVHLYEYEFTCWDLLFCLKSDSLDRENTKWCDIEDVIHWSLTNTSENKFSWKNVYSVMHMYYQATNQIIYSLPNNSAEVKAIAYYLIAKNWKEKCIDLKHFYDALLCELIKFEKSFGIYIRFNTGSEDYQNEACNLSKKLAESDEVQIDSFNYSDFTTAKTVIRHINGTCDNPIFGIDLTPEEEGKFKNLGCFTKTARRLRQDAFSISTGFDDGIDSISSAVVFGHSLNKMDYDYFNYLFTMLDYHTFDIVKMGTIKFVYRIYDSNRTNEIRSNYAFNVYKILNYYETYVNNSSHHVLINMLRNSGKLKIINFDSI